MPVTPHDRELNRGLAPDQLCKRSLQVDDHIVEATAAKQIVLPLRTDEGSESAAKIGGSGRTR